MPSVELDGVRLHYSDSGAGPCVFWNTGGGGDGRMWSLAQYTAALPTYRHLALDHRGHGRSDRPTRLEEHRIEEYVADVLAVLDHAGVDRAVFVGYSAGGTVGLRGHGRGRWRRRRRNRRAVDGGRRLIIGAVGPAHRGPESARWTLAGAAVRSGGGRCRPKRW